jgi:ABC-type branched-subunit amino acid transport system substrate-binding protein
VQSPHPVNRRQALFAAGAFACPSWALAQPGKTAPASRGIVVMQVVDTSAGQQDVSRDFLVGSRAAWQDINARGGVRGRPVQHLAIEVNGTAASMQAAIAAIRDNLACVAVSGSAGDLAATQVAAALRQERVTVAHAAPWLQNSGVELDEQTFPIFAPRQEQIAHALKSLSAMSVQEVGVVYATDVEHTAYRADLVRIAAELKVKLQSFPVGGDLTRLGQRLTSSTPAIVLFVGGTPELAQFTQGLEKQTRQRYVVALADVNLQTMLQMGAARNTPVIATQAVPVVTASQPIVRSYREVLARLFDEPPTPLSLAGFIAARYTYEVLNEVEGNLTRATALAAFQRRGAIDIGGFRVSYDGRRRVAAYVTQSMLTADGRVIG